MLIAVTRHFLSLFSDKLNPHRIEYYFSIIQKATNGIQDDTEPEEVVCLGEEPSSQEGEDAAETSLEESVHDSFVFYDKRVEEEHEQIAEDADDSDEDEGDEDGGGEGEGDEG